MNFTVLARHSKSYGKKRSTLSLIFLLLLLLLLSACGGLETPAEQANLEVAGISDLQAVLRDVNGFGKNTTGGKNGKIIEVTNLNDSGSGSLRNAVKQSGRTWIVFKKGLKGQLKLKTVLKVGSNTTIDGRGANITVTGRPIEVDGHTKKRVGNNVIVTHLKFKDSVSDSLRVRDGAKNVWIHHNTFGRAGDGQIDIINGGTDVTISWNSFGNHGKTMLIGSSRNSKTERVTLHHNYFSGNGERMPKSTRARIHFYNNYVRNWRYVAAYAEDRGEIYSEANIYQAGSRKRASNYSTSKPGYLKVGRRPIGERRLPQGDGG